MRGTVPRPEPDLVALTRELHPRLVGTLALYTGDRHLAEDLAQEALIRLHQHWPTVRNHPSPTAWTSRVALNLAGSWWRRRGAERRANRRSLQPSGSAGPEPADVLAIRTAVAALARPHRSVIVLRFYAGLSVRETAEALGRPDGTVKSLTHAAVAELRRVLVDIDDIDRPSPPSETASLPLEPFRA